jgi:hypothetical protein
VALIVVVVDTVIVAVHANANDTVEVIASL